MKIESLMVEAERCLGIAKTIVEREPLIPTAFVFRDDNPAALIMPMRWKSDAEKRLAVDTLRMIAKVGMADGIIVILDAFVIQRPKGSAVDERPMLAPDRKNAIILNILVRGGDVRLIMQPYAKTEGGVVFDEKIVVGPDHIDGIFTKIFEPEEVEQRWQM